MNVKESYLQFCKIIGFPRSLSEDGGDWGDFRRDVTLRIKTLSGPVKSESRKRER